MEPTKTPKKQVNKVRLPELSFPVPGRENSGRKDRRWKKYKQAEKLQEAQKIAE